MYMYISKNTVYINICKYICIYTYANKIYTCTYRAGNKIKKVISNCMHKLGFTFQTD